MACDPDTIPEDAKCWMPLSDLQLEAALLSQLCIAAGNGCDPEDLAESATCWMERTSKERWAAFVWLLCQWIGDSSCDPDTILEDAKCWLPRSSHEKTAALVQVFCDANGGCVIADVLEDSACFQSLNHKERESVMVWLMCQIAGDAVCDPETVIESAKCWLGRNTDELQSASIILACYGSVTLPLVYFLSDSDNGDTLTFEAGVAQLVVVPNTLSNGFSVTIVRGGTGMVHIVPGNGVTPSTLNGFRIDTAGTAMVSFTAAIATITGNITTDLIEIGGIPSGSFVADSFVGAPFTLVQSATAPFLIRQDGQMRGIVFRTESANNAANGFNFRVFRPVSGGTFAYIGKTESFGAPTANANFSKRFTNVVYCIAKDGLGNLCDDGLLTNNTISVKSGGTIYYDTGDIQSNHTFPNTVPFSFNAQILASPPNMGFTGDSIMGGFNVGSPFTTYQDGGPSGTLTSQIPFQMRSIFGLGMEYQNQSKNGQDFSWVRSTGVPALIATKAAIIWIHCGVNDVFNGRTWNQVEADLDAIAALLVNGERLMLDEILPWTAGNDSQAATIRTFNANMATWCDANNATLVLCHDAMGQIRVSTGFLDDLKTAYNQDGVHLTQAGVNAMASLLLSGIGL